MTSTLARTAALALALGTGSAKAAPPAPSGAHPRLFLGGSNLAVARANAATAGTASTAVVARCQETIDDPQYYSTRGGADGDSWPGAAVSCAFAYLVTQDAAKQEAYLTQAVKYWAASLNDDQDLNDGLGCTAAQLAQWNGSAPASVVVTITHDTGYPMRWYGPYIALTYDWLHDANDSRVQDLLPQTRGCLTAWVDHYTASGYHADEPGANYNAGYVAGKTLAAVAIGAETSDGSRLWNETVDGVFGQLLVGEGLAGLTGALGSPAGVLVGGDWGEGWQYGPLSVLEYAAAARVVEENGAPLPEMEAWTNSLVVRTIHATVPTLDGQWVGGDFDSSEVYQSPTMNQLDAVLLGPSSDTAAGWAAGMKQLQSPPRSNFIWNALAELRSVTPADYRQQTPPPPRWYVARGTRTVYARTSWDANAFWAVFSSPPEVNSDHHHFAAGNFVFSRGGDHLVVDPSTYGEPGTLETNAVAADSSHVTGDYAPSQTPWSQAELPWARGTDAAVYAARGDFARAFRFASSSSDIPYAHREWAFLPEGEIVVIDRVHTADGARSLYLNFHTLTGGTLSLTGRVAVGTAGGSKVAIQRVLPAAASPTIFKPAVTSTYEYPCGSCTNARFAVDDYSLEVPGPWAVAIHVIDGLAASESPAQVGSLNDDDYDPAPKQNGGVVGAAVYRGSKQSYVVASSGVDGQVAGGTMTYGVPGASASRHVVFDAPEDGNGRSLVSAAAISGRCVVTITAGAGFAGRPLLFSVGTAAGGCVVTEDSNVAPGEPPPGGGLASSGGSGGGGGGCSAAPGSPGQAPGLVVLCALAALALRRRRIGGRS
jgi:hypothetical protein